MISKNYSSEILCEKVIEKYLKSPESFNEYVGNLSIGFCIIIDTEDCLIAYTDRIKSYPLFYRYENECITITNSPRMIAKPEDSVSLTALTQFRATGYVLGVDTLLFNVKQVLPGTKLESNKIDGSISINRYYKYQPAPKTESSEEYLIQELSNVLDNVIKKTITRINGRQVIIPLSGGLDSRIIACKFVEHGYKNIVTFSYGANGNYEAKIAKKVARKLGVKWYFVPVTHSGFKNFFWNSERKNHWKFADGLSVIPNMQDILPLLDLIESGVVSPDAVVINGQSGDFITGGHIPRTALENDLNGTIDYIIKKHFSLNVGAVCNSLRECLIKYFNNECKSPDDYSIASTYETWEWEERQSKYVVNGQLIYDWLGLDWELPFWENELMDFWATVPVEKKINQELYKRYLDFYDYKGLFLNFKTNVWRWPGLSIIVVYVAQVVKILFGNPAKDKFYSYCRYIGHYGPFYSPWGLLNFLSFSKRIRNALPLHIRQWEIENTIQTYTNIKIKLGKE